MEQSFRKAINEGNFYDRVFKGNKGLWDKLCSAMDAIGDSSLAIEDFMSRGVGANNGEKYIRLYGLLQAAYLQQDAIKSLFDVVWNTFSKQAALKGWDQLSRNSWEELRSYRNVSVGHPTDCNSFIKTKSVHAFVSRVTIGDKGFQIMISDGSGFPAFKYVDLNKLIAGYKSEAQKIMDEMEKYLKNVKSSTN